MASLSEQRLLELLQPYLLSPVPSIEHARGHATTVDASEISPKLLLYLDLLLHWNSRTNLTSVRDPEAIVQRHFGESLFAGRTLATLVADGSSVLDLGSGAGFPGLPTQLLLPAVRVTLAESQGKKVAFLREAARKMEVPIAIWPGRVESMDSRHRFDAVMMRSVDSPAQAEAAALARVTAEGWLLRLGSDAIESGYMLPGPAGGKLHAVQAL